MGNCEGQINMFEILSEQSMPEPMFTIGQEVYIRELDVVRHAIITGNWLCKPLSWVENQELYYGYDITFTEGGHNVIHDTDVGDTVFCDEESAVKNTDERHYDKVNVGDIAVDECVGYEYFRSDDNHRLSACIAKIGSSKLYEKDFICYSFIRSYSTSKERDKQYNKLLSKIQEEAQREGATKLDGFPKDTLYKVGNVYASRGYAMHHMKIGA